MALPAPSSSSPPAPASDRRSSKLRYVIIALIVLSLACLFGAVVSVKLLPETAALRFKGMKGMDGEALSSDTHLNYTHAIEPVELLVARQELRDLANKNKKDAVTGAGQVQNAGEDGSSFPTSDLLRHMQAPQSRYITGSRLRTLFIVALVVAVVAMLAVLGTVFSSELLRLVGLGDAALVA